MKPVYLEFVSNTLRHSHRVNSASTLIIQTGSHEHRDPIKTVIGTIIYVKSIIYDPLNKYT